MPGKPIARRALENDPKTGKPEKAVIRVCEGKDHHRFDAPAAAAQATCPVCEARTSRVEQRLRD